MVTIVVATRFLTQPEIQHGKLDVAAGPAYEDTARRARMALRSQWISAARGKACVKVQPGRIAA